MACCLTIAAGVVLGRALCSYTHPELPDAESRKPCRSLRELKQLLAAARQLQFCDICLEGRKVPLQIPALFLHACMQHASSFLKGSLQALAGNAGLRSMVMEKHGDGAGLAGEAC